MYRRRRTGRVGEFEARTVIVRVVIRAVRVGVVVGGALVAVGAAGSAVVVSLRAAEDKKQLLVVRRDAGLAPRAPGKGLDVAHLRVVRHDDRSSVTRGCGSRVERAEWVDDSRVCVRA